MAVSLFPAASRLAGYHERARFRIIDEIGAALAHRDGKGLSLILSVIPMNGQIVLREPLPKQ